MIFLPASLLVFYILSLDTLSKTQGIKELWHCFYMTARFSQKCQNYFNPSAGTKISSNVCDPFESAMKCSFLLSQGDGAGSLWYLVNSSSSLFCHISKLIT
jgi:hypothetical protein